MALTIYRRGAERERRIVNKARKEGKIAFRSAGSHSPIDVCIIDMENKTIEFVQSKLHIEDMKKVDGTPGAEMQRALDEFKDLQGAYNVCFSFR